MTSERKVGLGPGQTVAAEGELRAEKIEALRKYVMRVRFKNETMSESMLTTETFLPVPRRTWEVKVDGKLDEWRGRAAQVRPEQMTEEYFNPLRGKGLEDLAAATWLAWDESGLYMAIEAKDDRVVLSEAPTVWDFDSLQIACDPLRDDPPRAGFEREDFELEIARMRDGKVFLDAGRFPEGKIESVVEQTVKVAVEPLERGGGLSYEIFIPAELFHPARWELHSLLGFNFILNDNDGEGREGWWELAPGIGYGKEPFQYPAMWLVEEQQKINSQDRQDGQD
ncbi:MAG: sugar-binding protein [bacterium]